jgi:hypothetical protein
VKNIDEKSDCDLVILVQNDHELLCSNIGTLLLWNSVECAIASSKELSVNTTSQLQISQRILLEKPLVEESGIKTTTLKNL